MEIYKLFLVTCIFIGVEIALVLWHTEQCKKEIIQVIEKYHAAR